MSKENKREQKRVESKLLQCKEILVDFDGYKAIQGLDFSLAQNELHFLIGPNGAGKTTLLDVICGKVRPTGGSVYLLKKKVELSKLQEHHIAQQGVGRKFQAPSIFPFLTVQENLEISMKQPKDLWSMLRAKSTQQQQEKMNETAKLIGLIEEKSQLAGALSHGQKQWLEIGMVLMQEPTLFLLDEPIAGMSEEEKEKTGLLLQKISKLSSVLVVEHDMDFVRTYAKTVTVMHEGKILCSGNMKEVQSNARVVEVYLGRKEDKQHATASTA